MKTLTNRLNQKGFALISVITVVILLALVAVALLTIASKNSGNQGLVKERDKARSNAKLALMEAIGVLQQTTGQDTSITFPADIFENRGLGSGVYPRQLVGASESWMGEDHDATGLPIAPDYSLKTGRKFKRWFVSGAEGRGANNPPSLVESDDTVPLLTANTFGDPQSYRTYTESEITDLEVHITPTAVEEGAIAWWIKADNQAVKLRPFRETSANNEISIADRFSVSAGADGEIFGISNLTDTDKTLTFDSLNFISDAAVDEDGNTLDVNGDPFTGSNGQELDRETVSEFFLDTTTYARGLIVNHATGGLKRDLSLLSEAYNGEELDPPSESFPAFTINPESDDESLQVFQGSPEPYSTGDPEPLIYPFASLYNLNIRPVCNTWTSMIEYATNYKTLTSSGNPIAKNVAFSNTRHLDRVNNFFRFPILSRVQWVLSISAVLESGGGYTPAIVLNPVVTVWNPYSVALDMSDVDEIHYEFYDAGSPLRITYQVGNDQETLPMDDLIMNRIDHIDAFLQIGGDQWLPGEVRTYSVAGDSIIDRGPFGNNGNGIDLEEGYNPDAGIRIRITENPIDPQDPNPDEDGDGDNGFQQSQPGNTQFTVLEEARVTANYTGPNSPNVEGTGYYFTQKYNPVTNPAARNCQSLLDEDDAQLLLGATVRLNVPPAEDTTLADLFETPQPIMGMVTSFKNASDIYPDELDVTTENPDDFLPSSRNVITNGIHNISPITGFNLIGLTAPDQTTIKGRMDAGSYEMVFYPISDSSSVGAPSGLFEDPTGYVGSGITAADGRTNLVISELPTRPLLSIGDLTHFSINSTNATPPLTLNPILNSRTSPFIHSDLIQMTELGTRIPHSTVSGLDHSYAANHVIVDDWFVTGITPQQEPWSAIESKSLINTYQDFLDGTEPLKNAQYLKARGATDDASALLLNNRDIYLDIAAELEIDGMFNINSTSVRAWRSILKQHLGTGANAEIIRLSDATIDSPGDIDIRTFNEGERIFPRNIISNSDASEPFPSLVEPAVFTDDDIDLLANNIVAEIKKRGPFLSLSEFVNRQLLANADSSPEQAELANAGAVEAALLSMANPTSGPYAAILSAFTDQASTEGPDGNDITLPASLEDNRGGYVFQKAAEGSPAYGFPGWTRQADILRPISGIIAPRDDTFTIRAYGASDDGTEAWCEAIVQRTIEYVEDDDSKDKRVDQPFNSAVNRNLGRRYKIISFRWLNKEEI